MIRTLLAIAILCAGTAHAEIYRWVDDEGVTQYSEAAPRGRPSERVDIQPPPSPEAVDEARQELQSLRRQELARKLAPQLLRAIEEGEGERALALLREGADPEARDAQGRTALMYAAINGQTSIVMPALLRRGAKVNARSADGTTALIAAVSYGDPGAVRLLLDQGADVNARDAGGRTALAWAEGRLKTAPPDRSRFPGMPERNQYGDLMFATQKELREIVELLGGAGAR